MEKETVQKLNSNEKQVLVLYLIASFWQLNWRLIKQHTIQVSTHNYFLLFYKYVLSLQAYPLTL